MNSTSKTLIFALIISLFSLATLQGYRVITQTTSSPQVLGDSSYAKNVPCEVINNWQKQYCAIVGNTPPMFTTPTSTTSLCLPRPACLDQKPSCKLAKPIGGWCPTKPTSTPSKRQ